MKYGFISIVLLGISGCTLHTTEHSREIVATVATSEADVFVSSETTDWNSALNASYTIEDVRQGNIQDAVAQRILEDGIVRLKKQNKFYDTVSYLFELTTDASEERVSIKIKERYSDTTIETLSYTEELATFNQ